jgi:DNA-binding XRE family transcriptional regulator
MKTKPGKGVAAKPIAAKHVTLKGKRVVVLDETEFDLLMRKADLWEPTKPAPDADGNYPAVEAVLFSIAIDIIRDRRRLRLTQAELARRAGIRLETLIRIESAARRPFAVRTIEKIDLALTQAEAGLGAHSGNGMKSRSKKAKATA